MTRATAIEDQSTMAGNGNKLFIWEDVLHRDGPGLVVALAPDLPAALSEIRWNSRDAYLEIIGCGENAPKAPKKVIDLDMPQKKGVWLRRGGI